MPHMMDANEMDVDMDDLFGDGAGMLPVSQPIPKEIYQRIDELRSSGACQTIAWSKLGCIASITTNGTGLDLQNLRVHPKDGTWALNESSRVPHLDPIRQGGVPLKHLSWSTNGSDLAVIDAAGRVAMLSISHSLNKTFVARSSEADPIDELHAVVGSYWLNLSSSNPKQKYSVLRTATKTNDGYSYSASSLDALGPVYPFQGKAAFLCVTASGMLRLFWSTDSLVWKEMTTDIDSNISLNDVITHASVCADKNNTLLMALATSQNQVRICRVHIQWTQPQKDGQGKIANPILSPAIVVEHLTSINCMETTLSEELHHISQPASSISHLRILPPTDVTQPGQLKHPNLITVRTHLPQSSSQYPQESESVVDKWELSESINALHPAFEQLGQAAGNRKGSTDARATVSLQCKRQQSLNISKVITWIDTAHLDRLLVLGFSDGSIEYRDRFMLIDIATECGLDKFYHPTQVGFTFPESSSSIVGAISASSFSIVHREADGKIALRGLAYQKDDLAEVEKNEAEVAGIIAALTLGFGSALQTSSNQDDVLAISAQFKHLEALATKLSCEIVRTLKAMVDYSEESHHDSLIRNTLIQTVLGISHSLGYSGDAYQRSFASMIAWMTLQLRNCVVLTTMAVNIKVPRQNSSDQKMTGYEDPEAVRILAGSVRWCLDFLCWIIDSLIHPPESPLKDGKALADLSIDELNAYLFSTKNVALHLLLSSSTRGFLIAICRRLIHLDYTARKTLSSTVNSDPQGSQASIVSNSLRASYTAIASLKQNSIVPVEIFDTFVNTIAQLMKDTYLTHNQPVMKQLSDAPGQVNRNTIEAQVLCGGELPASFALAISKILNEALPKLKKEIDAAQLFFHSYAGLNLPLSDASLLGSNASSSLALASKARTKNAEHRVRHTIDIFCRRPIEVGRGAGNGPHDRRYRRCARCGAAMEDIASRQHVIQFLVMQQRRCFCSGSWNVLQGGRVVA